MKHLRFRTIDGHALVFVGDASEFADNEDVSGPVLGSLKGQVAWIEWIQAARPRGGNTLLDGVLDSLRADGVVAVGAHAIPLGVPVGAPEVQRLTAFYMRHGFSDVSDLASWSEWPVVLIRFERGRQKRLL